MSRELKFRAWSEFGDTPHMVDMDPANGGQVPVLHDLVEEAGWHVMQYTGLVDIDGSEIYEGDLLQGEKWEKPRKVIFNEGCYMMTKPVVAPKPRAKRLPLSGREIQSHKIKIVGNIYENPELLANAAA